MTSVAELWNQALGHIGSDAEITDPDTDRTVAGQTCRRHWATVRDEILRDFAWPRFKVTEALALVEEDPNGQWSFSYAAPAGYSRILRVLDENSPPVDNTANRVPYMLGRRDDGSVLIFTNLEDAFVEYARQETDVNRWDSDAVGAAALLLASRISPKFGPDAVKLGDRAFGLYRWRLGTAQANALNEEQTPLPADGGDFYEARNA